MAESHLVRAARRLLSPLAEVTLLLIFIGASQLIGCNLGFEVEELTVDLIGDDTRSSDVPPGDGHGEVLEDSGGEDFEDTSSSITFSDQNCGIATQDVESLWECVGAPRCGASMMTVKTDGGSGVVVVCTESEGLRWHPYVDGQWQPSFQFGGGGDRPVVGSWGPLDRAGGATDGVGVVRRAVSGDLEWTLMPTLALTQSPTIYSFGEGVARPFTGDVNLDGQSELLTYTAASGTLSGFMTPVLPAHL